MSDASGVSTAQVWRSAMYGGLVPVVTLAVAVAVAATVPTVSYRVAATAFITFNAAVLVVAFVLGAYGMRGRGQEVQEDG